MTTIPQYLEEIGLYFNFNYPTHKLASLCGVVPGDEKLFHIRHILLPSEEYEQHVTVLIEIMRRSGFRVVMRDDLLFVQSSNNPICLILDFDEVFNQCTNEKVGDDYEDNYHKIFQLNIPVFIIHKMRSPGFLMDGYADDLQLIFDLFVEPRTCQSYSLQLPKFKTSNIEKYKEIRAMFITKRKTSSFVKLARSLFPDGFYYKVSNLQKIYFPAETKPDIFKRALNVTPRSYYPSLEQSSPIHAIPNWTDDVTTTGTAATDNSLSYLQQFKEISSKVVVFCDVILRWLQKISPSSVVDSADSSSSSSSSSSAKSKHQESVLVITCPDQEDYRAVLSAVSYFVPESQFAKNIVIPESYDRIGDSIDKLSLGFGVMLLDSTPCLESNRTGYCVNKHAMDIPILIKSRYVEGIKPASNGNRKPTKTNGSTEPKIDKTKHLSQEIKKIASDFDELLGLDAKIIILMGGDRFVDFTGLRGFENLASVSLTDLESTNVPAAISLRRKPRMCNLLDRINTVFCFMNPTGLDSFCMSASIVERLLTIQSYVPLNLEVITYNNNCCLNSRRQRLHVDLGLIYRSRGFVNMAKHQYGMEDVYLEALFEKINSSDAERPISRYTQLDVVCSKASQFGINSGTGILSANTKPCDTSYEAIFRVMLWSLRMQINEVLDVHTKMRPKESERHDPVADFSSLVRSISTNDYRSVYIPTSTTSYLIAPSSSNPKTAVEVVRKDTVSEGKGSFNGVLSRWKAVFGEGSELQKCMSATLNAVDESSQTSPKAKTPEPIRSPQSTPSTFFAGRTRVMPGELLQNFIGTDRFFNPIVRCGPVAEPVSLLSVPVRHSGNSSISSSSISSSNQQSAYSLAESAIKRKERKKRGPYKKTREKLAQQQQQHQQTQHPESELPSLSTSASETNEENINDGIVDDLSLPLKKRKQRPEGMMEESPSKMQKVV